jgi:hypothetical protein
MIIHLSTTDFRQNITKVVFKLKLQNIGNIIFMMVYDSLWRILMSQRYLRGVYERFMKTLVVLRWYLEVDCRFIPGVMLTRRCNSLVARWGYLAKIPPKQVIADFGRGSSVESESEWCPAGIFERFEFSKMASKMAVAVTQKTKTCVCSQV